MLTICTRASVYFSRPKYQPRNIQPDQVVIDSTKKNKNGNSKTVFGPATIGQCQQFIKGQNNV